LDVQDRKKGGREMRKREKGGRALSYAKATASKEKGVTVNGRKAPNPAGRGIIIS
jgi:hypothetical protein